MESTEYSRRRVLMLDDDSTTLLILSQALQAYGMEVIACREIEAAESILDHWRVEALVTDLCVSPMGGLEGVRLVRHMAAHFPETEVVVMSAHISGEIRRMMIGLGATSVFEKPVDPKVLALQLLRGWRAAGDVPGRVHDVELLEDYLAVNPVFAVLQPIVALGEGPAMVHGVESLARGPGDSILRHPELLFAYASRKDRLLETDLLCIRAGLAEARRIGRGFRIFVNVQPRSMTAGDFCSRVSRMVREAGFLPEEVVFELTEQETILNPRAFAATLAEVRALGFRIAMDDYGMGHSNLAFLLDFKPDYVKLSGVLTKGVASDRARQEVVRSTAEMLRRLGIPAILECVETAEEVEAARALGVEFAQGYHFSRPLRAEELVERGAFSAGRPAALPAP